MSTSKAGRLVRVGLYDLTPGYLGKGNFAIVRLGVHRLTKTSVAVKIVDKADLDEENLQKISREIEIMRRLNHTSIIRLFQVMETDAMIYIVTEFASKGDIFDHLVKTGKMPEPQACHYFAQILSAVKYCHTHGVVHRDLKVENLLLDADSNIKLADFGFSNYYASETSLLSTWCGSPPYAAPELFEGKKYVGPKVDIWSLGVVLYVLVSGTLPFDGPTLMDLRERVVKCQYRVPFFLSQECEHLLKGLLVIEPEKRMSIDNVARHPWMTKCSVSPLTKAIIDQILSIQKPDVAPLINEATVDAISRTVNVPRETVIDCVRLNKCDDLCAIYKMVEVNKRDLERERLQAVASMMPPLSPTSMTPFFTYEQPKAGVTEVYNPEVIGVADDRLDDDERSLAARRHTLGPGHPPKYYTPPRPYLVPGGRGAILPQTNLMQNLPLVSNLPPESFSVKNPHLLKPPPALLGHSSTGRRASDGGGAYFHAREEAHYFASSQALLASVRMEAQRTSLSSNGPMASILDSPRKRRSGLNTVRESPPEIHPDLVQEVELRIRAQATTAASTTSTVTTTPKTSPNKPGLRARRTGLKTVMEFNVKEDPEASFGVQRLSDSFRCNSISSNDASPCDAIKAMQEEAARLSNEGAASSADSASSGYMSPHFYLRPPSPSDDLHMQPRRSSDSGVDMPTTSEMRNSSSVPSQTIQRLYDEMYMDPSSPTVSLNNSRRYSYPNSPVHAQMTSSTTTSALVNAPTLAPSTATPDLRVAAASQQQQPQVQLSAHLQQLRLQHQPQLVEEAAPAQRPPMKWKGSITQGVPSRPPTASLEAVPVLAHSISLDEAFEQTVKARGISGSASSIWQPHIEDTEVDYMSLPYTPLTSAAAFGDSYNNPEICVTNVTGDQIKYVFGAASLATTMASAEPMDHS